MELEKIFHKRDAFFIAEALDAIANGIPIPVHTQKEFHDQPDAFVVWSKIVALAPSIPSGDSKLLSVKIPLTSAQIQTLNSIPVLAIPAPGVGKAIDIISVDVIKNAVAPVFTSNYLLIGETISKIQMNSDFGTNILNNPFPDGEKFLPVPGAGSFQNFEENVSMSLFADADSAVGNSNVNVYILYRIVTL